ncbi:ATP-binding protein [Nocardia brevicatena]|uniref:ATP-binding protein n=1 Tax=Nocardia brevicatena TaxID=37327 RepID=UPI0002D6519C|nr:ATP-binding protein [Nocardia brevicatena]
MSAPTASVVAVEPAPTRPGSRRRRFGPFALSESSDYGSAVDRIQRRFGLAIGVGGSIAAVLELPEILAQSSRATVGWSLAIMVLAFGLFPILAGVSVVAGPRVIRAVSGTAAVGYLASMALILIAYAQPLADPSAVWVYRLLAIGVLAAGLSWRTAPAMAYLAAGAILAAIANVLVVNRLTVPVVTEGFARAAGLCVLFLWCLVYAKAAAVRVDRESEVASNRAAAVAGAAARDRERARFAALIHDGVLSTLLDASRSGTESPILQRQAERTLDQLDACRDTEAGPDRLDTEAVVGFLRSAVHEVNGEIGFTAYRAAGNDELRMPVRVASTLAAALAEAARNSVRHADIPGRTVCRTVTVTVGAGGIRVVFRDEGAGFDQSRVPADRLGISVSILGRMRQLSGGAGFVESTPGQGTTVTLVWGSDG